MIFSELYSAYYNTVARILKAAVDHPLSKNELRGIIGENAFGESILNIEPSIVEGKWQLIRNDGTTPIEHIPTMPLTILEKRWLKAIYADPRIRLFTDEIPEFPDVKPLFETEDIMIIDKYADGDPFTDDMYIKTFRMALEAIWDRRPLSIEMTNRKGGITRIVMIPERLEYSEKDDKFRLIGDGRMLRSTVNLGRVVRCKPYNLPFEPATQEKTRSSSGTVEFELFDQRNALERVLLHFAHFEKQAERLDGDRYRVRITYDKRDETEMVIRILSFGPMVKVTSPQSFVELIKDRLIRQKSCGH